MSFNFNLASAYNLYTDPTYTNTQFAYTQNPIAANAPSIFAMMRNQVLSDASYALGGFANVGTVNGNLLTPQFVQNMNNPFNFNQYDFTNMYNFNGFAQQMGMVNGAINPFMNTYSNPAVLAQGYTNPFATPVPAQTAPVAVDETVRKLNTYGISSTGDKDKDEKALKLAEANEQKTKSEATNIAEELYAAMKGVGTKNEKLTAAVNKINKDNVLEVLKVWNKNFADSMNGETLIQSIQAEHHTGWFGNQQETLENKIADALFKKAQELDLKEEGHAFRAKLNAEHDRWFTSDENVDKYFNTIIEQVSTKYEEMKMIKAQKAYQNNK